MGCGFLRARPSFRLSFSPSARSSGSGIVDVVNRSTLNVDAASWLACGAYVRMALGGSVGAGRWSRVLSTEAEVWSSFSRHARVGEGGFEQ